MNDPNTEISPRGVDGHKSKKVDFKIKYIMIGRTNTGKSSIVRRYVDQNFDENDACTVAVEAFYKTLVIEGKTIKLKILDTASDRMDKVARSYYT